MSTSFNSAKARSYLSKIRSVDRKKDSFISSISEQTRTQLDQYKNTRKLPLLGMQFLRIKDKKFIAKEKPSFNPNFSFQDEDSDESDIKVNDPSASCFPKLRPRLSNKPAFEKDSILINNQDEAGSGDGSVDNLSDISFSRKYKAPYLGLLSRETAPDLPSNHLHDSAFKATFRRNSFNYKTISAPLTQNKASKHNHNKSTIVMEEKRNVIELRLTVEHKPGKFATEPTDIVTKARSKSVASRPTDINFGKGKEPEVTILRTHNSANPSKFPIIKISKVQSEQELYDEIRGVEDSAHQNQSPHLPVYSNQQPSGRTTIFVPSNPISRKQSNAMTSVYTSQAQLSQPESDDPFRINTEQSRAFGGKAFQNAEILESRLPMSVIEHPTIPKVKALQANRVLAGRPLQLPLSNAIEDVLKDIDKKTRKLKVASPLDDYAEDLLRGSFVDYFKELNPLGRLDTEQLTLLNGLNDVVRLKRGLTVGSKNGFQDFIDRSPESKAHKKAQILLNKLKEAQVTDGNPDEIIKEYRKDMPLDLSRQFLAVSFRKGQEKKATGGGGIGSGSGSGSGKVKKYNAWVSKKKFSGVESVGLKKI